MRFSRNSPYPCAQGGGGSGYSLLNDAACPHHYNYYYCDFGLRDESCRRRGGRGSGCRAALQAQGGRRGQCLARG